MDEQSIGLIVALDVLILLAIGLALFFLGRVAVATRELHGLLPAIVAFVLFGLVFLIELPALLLPAEALPAIFPTSAEPLSLAFRRLIVVLSLIFLVWGVYLLTRRELEIVHALKNSGKTADRNAVTAHRLATQLDQTQLFAQLGSWDWHLADNSLKYSDGLLRIYGLDLQEHPATYEDFEGVIHPDDRAVTRAILRRAATGESGHIEYRVVRPDGQIRTLHAQVEVEFAGQQPTIVHANLIDVTERVEAQMQTAFSTALHQAVVNSTLDGILTFDVNAKVELFNETAELLFGYSAAQMAGRTALKLLPPELAAHFREVFTLYLKTGNGSMIGGGPFEVQGRRKNGDLFPIEVAIADVQVQGKRLFVVTVRDITQRRQQEEQLRRAQKLQAVGQLTGGVAHDFNNIITSIMGNLDLLRESVADRPMAEKFADEALNAAGRAATLTQQLLAFSRRQALRPEPVDVNELVTGTTELLRKTLGANISIELDLAPDLWRTMVDEGQLESALLNLAFNSRDAMPDGGLLTIRSENFQQNKGDSVDGVAKGDYVALTVADTGSGMTAEVRQRVFEPFFTTKDVGKGSGLGLSMVYGFVRQSGGFVKLESTPDSGTKITLCLPQTEKAPKTARAGTPRSDSAMQPGGNERILVVEDDGAVRSFLQLALEVLGYEVLGCEDGEAALDILEAVGGVDLVLTDVMLPGMTGAELGTRIKVDYPDTPILFSSGYTRDEMIRNGRLDPDVQLIEKPFRREQLAAAVRQLLDGD